MKVDVARIKQEASAIANRQGFEALSMNALAEALGIRSPSLYSHVAGISEVKRLLALHGLKELEERAARAVMGKSGPDAVRALLSGYRAYARENPGVYAATIPTPPVDDAEWHNASERLSETCLAALQGFGLDGVDAIHALRGVRSLVHGFVSLEAAGALKNPVDRDESFGWLVEWFITALADRAAQLKTKRDAGGPS